jgi:hypothetical protein
MVLELDIETTVLTIVGRAFCGLHRPAKDKQLVVAAETILGRRRICSCNRVNIYIREWLPIQQTD